MLIVVFQLPRAVLVNSRAASECAPPSPVLSYWSWKGNSLPICTCPVSGGSKSPPTWTCQRNRWRSGFRTVGSNTKRKGRAGVCSAPTPTASATPWHRPSAVGRKQGRPCHPHHPAKTTETWQSLRESLENKTQPNQRSQESSTILPPCI